MTTHTLQTQQELMTEAYREYRRPLMQYSVSKLSNAALAEDRVQDTFVKAWSFLVNGGDIGNMKSFLYKILSNLIIDEYRRHKTSSLDCLIEEGFEPADDDHVRMIDASDGKATALFVRKLPEKYQKVISMRYAESLSIEEISESTHYSKNAVAVQIHRGLKMLRSFFAEDAGTAGKRLAVN